MKTPRIVDVLSRLDGYMISEALEESAKIAKIKEKRRKAWRFSAVAAAALLLCFSMVMGSFYLGGDITDVTEEGITDSGYLSEGSSDIGTQQVTLDIELVSRYPASMMSIVYAQAPSGDGNGQVDDPTSSVGGEGDTGAPLIMEWNGIKVTRALYYLLNRYDNSDIPYVINVLLDQKIESDPEYAAKSDKLKREYADIEKEYNALVDMGDAWVDINDRLYEGIDAESYLVTVEKVFGKEVADEFVKNGVIDRDAFLAQYGEKIDEMLSGAADLPVEDKNYYNNAYLVLYLPEKYENPADSYDFVAAFKELFGDALYEEYLKDGVFDFHSFYYSEYGIQLRNYIFNLDDLRDKLNDLKREIIDVDELREELREAAGKYYFDGAVDYDSYERDVYELYTRMKEKSIELAELWQTYNQKELASAYERLSGIDAEVVLLGDSIEIFIEPHKITQLSRFTDLIFGSASRGVSITGSYYSWNGLAVQIALFDQLIANGIDSSNRYAVGVSLSETLFSDDEWLSLKKEYDNLTAESNKYAEMYLYITELMDNKYSAIEIKEKLLGEYGAEVVDKYFSGDEFDIERYKNDSAEISLKRSEAEAAMDECADRLGREYIRQIYAQFSDQVEYISVGESDGYVIIYVTAEELSELENAEAYRFFLVPAGEGENTSAPDYEPLPDTE